MSTTAFVLLCICTVGTLANGVVLIAIVMTLNEKTRRL